MIFMQYLFTQGQTADSITSQAQHTCKTEGQTNALGHKQDKQMLKVTNSRSSLIM